MEPVILGGLRAVPGRVVRGSSSIVMLPTGHTEPLSCVIAAGHDDGGPRLLLTANIHGNEVTGLVVAHRVITALEAAVAEKRLVGTVVVAVGENVILLAPPLHPH